MITAFVDYLSVFYQAGNMEQLEVIARSMLAAIPDDIVALQFLGLALFQMGHLDRAYEMFKRVAVKQDLPNGAPDVTICELASVASYREATRVHSGLADGWFRIAQTLKQFGFRNPASRAFEAALASRGG